MKKIFLILFLIIIVAVVFFIFKKAPAVNNTNQVVSQNQSILLDQNVNNQNSQSTNNFQPPLTRAAERVTKKPFGIYITPKTSPVQPEKFQGYHTGTDFEIFPEELNIDVTVRAVCNGKLVLKRICQWLWRRGCPVLRVKQSAHHCDLWTFKFSQH
jgi:hypothetical protein